MASFFCTSTVPLNKSRSSCHADCIKEERIAPGFDEPKLFLRKKVKDLALKHKERVVLSKRDHLLDLTDVQFGRCVLGSDPLAASYERCRELYVKENDHFNFGTLLMNPEKQKAIWAIWAWGRRIDELVDGVNGSFATHETFDRMEERIKDIYQRRPFDIYDVALADTLMRYPIDFQLFKDLIDGTRLDLTNRRFKNIDEVLLYRYYSSGSFFLMLIQVMGIAPQSKATMETIYDGLVTLGNALTLIDSLRDVGEDAKMGRIYFPQDELKLANISEEEIFRGIVTTKWKDFMKGQMDRARMLLDQGAEIINELNQDIRWALWATVLSYRQDLGVIEARDYDIFSKNAMAGKVRRLTTLPLAYAKSFGF